MLHRNEKVELIKRVPLFSNCSKHELEEIAHIADEIDLGEGKEMTREGHRGREFFVLLEGEADVTKNGQSIEPTRLRAMGMSALFAACMMPSAKAAACPSARTRRGAS